MIRIHIVAGTLQQAEHVARMNTLMKSEWCYVSSPERLRGQLGGVAWLYGTYYQRRDFDEIAVLLRERRFHVYFLDER